MEHLKEWTCPAPFSNIGANVETSYLEIKDQKHDFGGHKSNMNEEPHQETLYPNSGYPKGIPHSGYHRPKWPQYGEYKYIPPLRFVHALEHGSILFLYHPCTPVELVQERNKYNNSFGQKFQRYLGTLKEAPLLDKQSKENNFTSGTFILERKSRKELC